MERETKRTVVSSDEIIKKYIDMVYRLALSRTKSKSCAEDVVQEVFLRYLSANKTFDSDEHIKAWLIRVTINCSNSVFASSWFKKTVPLSEEIPFDSPEKSEVYYAVAELPQKYRTVIHLFYYEDMSAAQIAECTGAKVSTVKSQLHRGRKMLKEKLKGGYGIV
ncbi:MAG: sigma-70 family RNA polymerase sigma factor, partial [Oscillospiraceae bacterium]|nr:sigma-70 family RNA polymerase sigma factor [Oscillospiraceae bacterium]